MDLGLGNLATVKNFVLPTPIVGDPQYDSVLATIASGIAQRFELYCNRRFGRVAPDLQTFDANRTHYFLPRYPMESVTKLEIRSTPQDDWSDITEAIVQQDESIGYIGFGCFLGDSFVLCRCTYTGGFWYETLEPLDANGVATVGYPTAQPMGSVALNDPARGALALQGAWLMQCLHEFECKDRLLPTGIVNAVKSRIDLRFEQMQLLPEVQNTIDQFRRFQIV